MYSFCKDIDCYPDASISERDFLCNDDVDNVFWQKSKKIHDLRMKKR